MSGFALTKFKIEFPPLRCKGNFEANAFFNDINTKLDIYVTLDIISKIYLTNI